jgi:hypothetical protein
MGEQQQGSLFRPDFNGAVRVEASRAALSEDGGVLVLRDVAQRLGLDDAVRKHIVDRRDISQITHSLPSLVRTAVFLHAQGWVDQDDADLLREDIAFRVGVADGRGAATAARPLASQPTMSRTVAMLADPDNLAGLHRVTRWVAFEDIRATVGRRPELTIDIDSFPRTAHGHQEGAAYNGHYHETCFHPIVAVADTGHFLDARMRPGNVHTADGAREFVEPLLAPARDLATRIWMRFDAGYVAPEFMDWLDSERVRFIARIRNNSALKARVADWAERVRAAWAAEPSTKPREATYEFRYRAQKWSRERRVIAVLVERLDGDGWLFDHLFFLVTNAARREGGSEALLARYRRRGTAENHIGELVNTIGAKVSSHGMAENEVNLLVGLLAYNLVHHVRQRLAVHLEEGVSLQRVRERFLKAAAQVVRHARRIVVRIGLAKTEAFRLLVKAVITPGLAVAEGSTAS